MPNLSASEYTQYLKFKAAAATPIRPSIQTRDNVTLSQSVLNAMTLTSQAAFVTTPYNVTTSVLPATVSDVSATTITAARTDILQSAIGDGTLITYVSSQPHGLVTGDVISIMGFATFTSANAITQPVTVVDSTTFTIPIAATGTATGTGNIVGSMYYTTSVEHGLVVGDTVGISGITNTDFNGSSLLVTRVPSATTFSLLKVITASSVSGETGTITGLVYYTTSTAHGLVSSVGTPLVTPDSTLTISGMSDFNATNLTSIYRAPSSTVFVLNTGATGTAITGQTGVLTITITANRNNSLRGLARVVGMPPNIVNQPKEKSTLSWTSGTSGSVSSTTSSKFVQSGGLPASGTVGPTNYTRLPQNAGWIQGAAGNVNSGPKRF